MASNNIFTMKDLKSTEKLNYEYRMTSTIYE